MRQDINPKTRRTRREIVDGQQRLRSVLSYIRDGFKGNRAHHESFRGRYFSGLDKETQRELLKYEFSVDLLLDTPDSEVYDIFARMNTYTEKLTYQELRNAKWFGEFKSSVYQLASEFITFFEESRLFTPKKILRMAEAEFVSELLLAIHTGIQALTKSIIDNAYRAYDDDFPNRDLHEKRFRETMDTIGQIFGDDLATGEFRAVRLFYPLFCAIYHFKFGLPKLTAQRAPLRAGDFPKAKIALERVEELIGKFKVAEEEHEEPPASPEDRKFYDALTEHWVHADKRSVMTQYICKQLIKAFKG